MQFYALTTESQPAKVAPESSVLLPKELVEDISVTT